MEVNNVIDSHACIAFDIPHAISEMLPADTSVTQSRRLMVETLHGAVHNNG